jgi:hypothetical protein
LSSFPLTFLLQGGAVDLSPNPYSLILSGEQEGAFICWNEPLVQFNNLTRIMVRESYENIYDLISANVRNNFKDHLVTGVPGIGKSHFCLYFLWRYITENPGSPILFESSLNMIYYLSPSNSFMTTRIVCTNLQYPYLVDFREVCEPAPTIGLFTVVFSSPDPKRYKQMMKGRASRYVMPVWTLEELFQLKQIHDCISLEEITQRFDLIGGVPRQIFDESLEDVQIEVTNSLNEKGREIAEHFFEQGFGMRDETISYTLIHLHPDPVRGYCVRKKNNYGFASPHIWKQIYDLHQRVILMQSVTYFNGGTGAYGGSFAGYHFENICLHALPIAQTVQKIFSLNGSTIQPRELSIPTVQYVEFRIQQLEPLPNVLYVPTKKNFESGDAFYFDAGELFVFQITVGASHPVKAHGLDTICALFQPPERVIENCHLIFVVPAQGQLNSKQNITTLKDEEKVSHQVKLFEKNQWRLEYHLAAIP